jgi:4-oxalocrotonate tautomerase
MTLIEVKLLQRVFTAEQKREMIEKLIAAMHSISGGDSRDRVLVLIDGVRSGDWGLGGQQVRSGILRRLVMKQCPMFTHLHRRRQRS